MQGEPACGDLLWGCCLPTTAAQELRAEAGEGVETLLLDKDNLERVLWGRLSFLPLGYPQTPLQYLLGCYSRASGEIRAAGSLKDEPLQEAVVGALVYGKQLVVSYTGLMLTMDMFPQVGGPSMHPSCDGLEGCGNVTPLRRGSFQEAAGRIEGCGRIFSRERRQERSK